MTLLSLEEQLKRLRFSGILETLEVRTTQAREQALSHREWLTLLLQDEIGRRESLSLQERFKKAKFEQEKTFESFDKSRYPLKIQELLGDLTTGTYIRDQRHVIIEGPTGSGKTHLAQALGHHACRQGKAVRFIRSTSFLREMHQSRADNSWEKALKRFVMPDLLILDDFGLMPLTFSQAEDIYELVAERHLKKSFVITSNRKVETWVELFPDAAMGNAVVDRLSNQSYGVILEGESYRRLTRPQVSQVVGTA